MEPPRPLYDTHAHLHAEAFDEDRTEVLARASAVGVRRVLTVSEDLADSHRLLACVARHPELIPALGVHPDRAPLISDSEVADVMTLIREHQAVLGAIGEVGLDHRPCWDDRARDRQAEVFRSFIRLGKELSLPLTVHSRGAGRRAIDLLLEEGMTQACLHAFDGRAVHGEHGAAAGLSFSIPPAVVRTRVLEKLVPRVPLDRLLLESDSPVLGPLARERNEPAHLTVALDAVASLRQVSVADLSTQIAVNSAQLFPRLNPEPGS